MGPTSVRIRGVPLYIYARLVISNCTHTYTSKFCVGIKSRGVYVNMAAASPGSSGSNKSQETLRFGDTVMLYAKGERKGYLFSELTR